MRPMTAWTLSPGAFRSANGFRRNTMKAALDWLLPSSSEKPTIESTFSICGKLLAMVSTRCTTSRVRVTLAASGNCTATKNAPWSSSGRKPVGVRAPSATMPPTQAPTRRRESTEIRMSRLTIDA